MTDRSTSFIAITAALLFASPTLAHAQDSIAPDAASQEENADAAAIIVTGSRVITDGNNSPTTVAIVSTETLSTTTPTNLADALNKLPQFNGGGRQTQTSGDASSGNFLNLRSVGSVRNLVLFDGNRLAPSAASGAFDINMIPQMLIQRVDVVTGGVSAVYGSDAVSGVVNFIVDRKFDGIKTLAQAGVSSRGDNGTVKLGIAGGTSLFGDRGHVIASFEYFDSNGVADNKSRKNGAALYTTTGSGTAANPYRLTSNSRLAFFSPYGQVVAAFAANGAPAGFQFFDTVFKQDGNLSPFVHGTPTGTPGTESGGDGSIFSRDLATPLTTKQGYLRFDYDLSDDIRFHAQGSYNESDAQSVLLQYGISFNNSVATISAQNPFLSQTLQNQLAASGVDTLLFFKFAEKPTPLISDYNTRAIFANAGFDGGFGDFKWNVDYSHSESRQRSAIIGNIMARNISAALDAVLAPASYTGSNFLLNSQGQRVVCRTTLTSPTLFPDCLPLNVFGRATEDERAVAATRGDSRSVLTNKLDTITGSVSGPIFDIGGRSVRAAISGEWRKLTLTNVSNNLSSLKADCTGLRYNCNAATTVFALGQSENANGKQSVKEIAAEVDVPLLADLPFAQSLNINGAVRYTDYSTSGGVTTWKVGLDWHPTDDLSFRATRSRDIRAPTVYELFQPATTTASGYSDVLTGTTGFPNVTSQGNPNLDPEKADTYTIGTVYRPGWFPDFSVAIDYFNIEIDGAISRLDGRDPSIAAQCNASGGTSLLCQLYERPFPYTNTTAANFPTRLFAQTLNVAKIKTNGVDVDVIYSPSFAGGDWMFRALGTYQPKFTVQRLPGDPVLNTAGVDGLPKVRLSGFIGYTTGPFSINVQERWHSATKHNADPTLIYDYPKSAAKAFTDLTLSFKVGSDADREGEFFFNVANLFDTNPAPVGAGAGNPGIGPIGINGDDVFGRSFTAGFRAKF